MIVLRNKNFARVDYEGLTKEGKESLKAQRDLRAKRLQAVRKANNDVITANGKKHQEAYTQQRNKLHELTLKNEAKEQEKIRQSVINKFGKAEQTVKNATSSVPSQIMKDKTKETGERIAKKGMKLGKAGKIALIGTGITAVGGTGLYAYKKHKDNKVA